MDPKFIKQIQDAGWHIEAVGETDVIGKCPSVGCQLRAKLKQGGHVPLVDPGGRRDVIDRRIESYADIQAILKARREGLALTIREVEEISGVATDHIAKMEKENPTKIPNAVALIDWAESLGFELVFRPKPLTKWALRTICETRDKTAARQKRFTVEQRRRNSR